MSAARAFTKIFRPRFVCSSSITTATGAAFSGPNPVTALVEASAHIADPRSAGGLMCGASTKLFAKIGNSQLLGIVTAL